MTTVKLRFRASSIIGKEGSLYYQIIQPHMVRHIKAGYGIHPHEWDAIRSEIRLSHDDAPRFAILSSIRDRTNREISRLGKIIEALDRKKINYTAEDVVCKYHTPTSDIYFMAFMRMLITQMRNVGKERVSETYTSALNSFCHFRHGIDLLFDEMTQETMTDYEIYLKGKGVKSNSSSFYMRNLRAVYNRAVESGLTIQHYPFRHVYTGIDKTVKRGLAVEAVRSIKDYELETGTVANFARDMFMFSFYTRGMSFVDMGYLKKTDLKDGILTYRRKKTGQILSIKWEACMQKIVDRHPVPDSPYLLPIIRLTGKDERRQYLNASHLANRHLKKIGQQLNLPIKLTMYVARHTWASIAKSKNIPITVISEALGHDSETTTQIYLASLDASALDKANRLVINELY